MLPRNQENALKFALELRSSRSNWDSLFERLAEMFHPNRTGFTSNQTEGEDRMDELNSGAPILARRGLSAAVSTMLRPAGRRWFHGKVKYLELMEDPSVREWLEDVTTTMHGYMYDPRAKMEPNCAMADDDLVTFGNGCIRLGFDDKNDHLKYRTRSMANVYYVTDSVGDVVGVVSFEMWSLRQIRERFGDDAMTKEMKKHLKGKNPDLDREFELVHICIPVEDAQAMGMTFKQPYSSLWMSVKCKASLESKGYDYFPYLTPRWDLSTGERYGRSPAMVALRDAQLLQAMTETMVDAGEKALNPPTWGFGDFVDGQFDLSAGGFTPIDPSGMQGNYPPINTVQLGTMPREIMEFIGSVEERVYMAFYRDVLELPSARDQDLTATEINARLDQYMRQAAPVFSRIESNYNAPHVTRIYKILEVKNLLPPKPEIIAAFEEQTGEDAVEFDYESPIKVARDKSEAMKIMEGIGVIVQGAGMLGEQAIMQVAENFSADSIARKMGPKLDLPEWVYEPLEAMMKGREQRQQQQEMMAQAEMAGKAAPALGAAAQAGKLIPDMANAGLIEGGDGTEDLPLPMAELIDFEGIGGLAEAMPL